MTDITQLKAGRYARMQHAKTLYANIINALAAGHRIQITTYTHSKIYTSPLQFKATKYSVFVARGKNWDCIDYCSVRSIS